MPEKLVRAYRVASILDVPKDQVYKLAQDGLLPAIRVGRAWRFDEKTLRKWIDQGGAGGWRRRVTSRQAAASWPAIEVTP